MPVRVATQAAVWILLWAFWTFVSRDHHPTLLIDAVATGMLMVASAAGFYWNVNLLWPRLRARLPVYGAALAVTIFGLAVVTAYAISLFYDVAWGPDPARYGFWDNVGLDAVWIAVHAVGGAAVVGLWRRWRHQP